jgi:hypothetical protein
MWDDLIVLFLSLALGSFALAAVMFVSDGIRARTRRSRGPSPLHDDESGSLETFVRSELPARRTRMLARRRNENGPLPKT